jgi:hypothetical protein
MTAKILTMVILSLSVANKIPGDEQNTQLQQPKFYPFLREGFVFDGVEGMVTRADEKKTDGFSRPMWMSAMAEELSRQVSR